MHCKFTGKPSDDPLDPDFVPSLFSFNIITSTPIGKKDRHERSKRRQLKMEQKEREKLDESKAEADVAEILVDLSLGEPRYKEQGDFF